MTKTANNQQRTLCKTKPNKAKVNIGNIDRLQKFTRRRRNGSLPAVGGTDVRIQKFTRRRRDRSLSAISVADQSTGCITVNTDDGEKSKLLDEVSLENTAGSGYI